mmetsp:Transcript_14449/g.13926  ORF Transcript_14449/g.13926 Transcript_14449/m.13926 type:complete len:87 (+) Transcript_14449:295-555(+)
MDRYMLATMYSKSYFLVLVAFFIFFFAPSFSVKYNYLFNFMKNLLNDFDSFSSTFEYIKQIFNRITLEKDGHAKCDNVMVNFIDYC